MPISDSKRRLAFSVLNRNFGSPNNQQKGFASVDDAAHSAATLVAAQAKVSFSTANTLVREWYTQAGHVGESQPKRLDAFTRQYIDTALWSSTDNANESGGEPLDKNYSSSDIDPATMTAMIADCVKFQEQFADLLSASGIDDERAGHCLWLSRNGHGSGFFDEDTIDEEFQEKLQDAAESYGNVDLQVDDGVISDGVHWTPTGTSEARRRPMARADGGELPEDLKSAIGTLAHNRQFTIAELEQYTRFNRPHIASHAKLLVNKMVKMGYLKRESHGHYFPTTAGWAWIEGSSVSETRRHHVADFTTLPEIIAHAQQEGATHVVVSRSGKDATVYFPIRSGGRYEEANLWHEHGYWHSPAPTHTTIVDRLPKGAEPIGEYLAGGQVAAESHRVRDYVAVDNHGRQLAGPFKDYGTAKQHADRAGGYVEFAMKEGRRRGVVAARRPAGAPARGSMMTASGVLMLAGELSKKVGGTSPEYIEGGHRWSDRNESATFTTYSPEHGQKVVVLVSIFEDNSTALDFFSDEHLSETNRYENIAYFLYGTGTGAVTRKGTRIGSNDNIESMVKDIEWVWKTVDGYAESWGGGQDDEMDEARRSVAASSSKAPIRRWMLANVDRFIDRRTGEIDCTSMVETWDNETQNGGVTTDPDHIAWDVAVEVANEAHRKMGETHHGVAAARASKAYFGSPSGADDFGGRDHHGYAIKIDGIDNAFPTLPPGRQMDAQAAIQQFKATAKTDWISTKLRKGQRPLAEVKRWIKAVQPDQFYARWSTDVDDDSVQIWYTGGNIGTMTEAHRPHAPAPHVMSPGAPAPLLLAPGPSRRARRPPPRSVAARRRAH